MRIDGWHIDGFGALKDFRLADIGPGVTVLLGENEAGKSTLLAFVRAMLFGFPDGRTNQRAYPPVRGGRHGGKLLLRDRNEGLWTVERYADARRTIGLLRPDGSVGDGVELGLLLGGVDARLFNSVFAFGLDELQVIGSLTGEGVSDRIFDAGISGAGISAREVMRRLQQRQDALLKQGRGNADINDEVRRLLDLDADERDARELIRQYEAFQKEEGEHEGLAATLQDESGQLQRRKTELEALIELQPQWQTREAAERELQALPSVDDANFADEVAGLLLELRAQRTRAERLGELEATQAGERAAMQGALERLGAGWDIERTRTVDTSVLVEDAVRARKTRLEKADESLRDAVRKRDDRLEDQAGVTAEADRLRNEMPSAEPLAIAEIDRRESVLRGLRDDASRLETLRLRAEQAPQPRDRSRLAFIFAALAALGAAGALIGGHAQLGVGLAVAAVLLALVAVLTRSRVPAQGQGAGEGEGLSVVAELRATMASAAGGLGLPSEPSTADFAGCDAALRTERTRRGEWESAVARVDGAQGREKEAARLVDKAEEALRSAQGESDRLAEDWAAWLEGEVLPQASPDGVLEVLEQATLARDAAARAEVAASLAGEIEAAGHANDETARRLLATAGRPVGGLPREALGVAAEQLDRDLARRAELIHDVGAIERQVTVRLSSCERPVAAREELECGDIGIWADESEHLGDQLEQVREQRDEALRRASAARTELRRIEASADIPRIQEERESVRARLVELTREYQVVSTARALIAETLRTYVRDRQPGVLARGSEAFAQVTNGRYQRVEQDEAGGLASLVVVSRDGQRLAPEMLSKGTQQQLYLAIRLALAEEFANRMEPLPLIMDDCLVNFDPVRARAVAGLLAEGSAAGQCLLFTCHPQTAQTMAAQKAGPVRVIEMAGAAHATVDSPDESKA